MEAWTVADASIPDEGTLKRASLDIWQVRALIQAGRVEEADRVLAQLETREIEWPAWLGELLIESSASLQQRQTLAWR